MSNLPLKALKWVDESDADVKHAAQSALHNYTILNSEVGKKYEVKYESRRGVKYSPEPATGFATIDEAKQWAWNHYNEKMQPYVKPMPTKVYELTYDCGDSYSTLFMTLDKQQAVDFMESVKDADLDFIASYGFDCAADELLIEQYEDNHPLAPYKKQIFNSIYEDGFSEWMLNYGGNSLVSSLGIIEHELFSTMQNLHKGERL